MKMYACKRLSKGYTLGKPMDFMGVENFKADTCSITATKAVREIFKLSGLDISKEMMDGGSMWLYNNNIMQRRDMIVASAQRAIEQAQAGVKSDVKIDFVLVKAIYGFMNVCLEKGYDIRFY